MSQAPTKPQMPGRPPPKAPAPTNAAKISMPAKSKTGTRTVLVATEGYGKTTVGALGKKPLVIMAPDELGYLTLYNRGLVPQCLTAQPRSWNELLATIEAVAAGQVPDVETLVIDAMVGMEMLLAWHVCSKDFEGDWGERGFQAWGRGKAIVAREWPAILPRLTAVSRRGIDVLVLGHAKIQKFSNPTGADYDRYECNVAQEVWARTKAWAEAVLFGTFQPIVDESRPEANIAKAKGKAIGQQRIMRCQYSAVADAKNTYGLNEMYIMPDDPAAFAEQYWGLMHGSHKQGAST